VTAIRVSPARDRRQRGRFIAFPYALHRHDPGWAPPLRRDVRTLLSATKNPFFAHAEAEHFLAERSGEVVGRITAIHNRAHNAFHQDRVGFFGFFESIDDPRVARALFERAGEWLAERGLDVMRGPASFSTNDEAGLLVEGFDTPAVVMMPHNPCSYVALVEGAGFRKAKDLLVYQRTFDEPPERLHAAALRLEKRRGITVRSLDMARFDQEVDLVKRLYNEAWERNWGFVPLSDAEIDFLAGQLRPVVVPELVAFAEHEGRPIGFTVVLPDFNVALRKNPSGRFFPGILRVLWASRAIDRLRVLLLGTIPEWRGKGVDALLDRKVWVEAHRRGFRWAEAGWILEDNHAMRNGLVNLGFEVYKTYRLYDKPIGRAADGAAGRRPVGGVGGSEALPC
jgi:GNAT superfamily N-acetyltransferase